MCRILIQAEDNGTYSFDNEVLHNNVLQNQSVYKNSTPNVACKAAADVSVSLDDKVLHDDVNISLDDVQHFGYMVTTVISNYFMLKREYDTNSDVKMNDLHWFSRGIRDLNDGITVSNWRVSKNHDPYMLKSTMMEFCYLEDIPLASCEAIFLKYILTDCRERPDYNILSKQACDGYKPDIIFAIEGSVNGFKKIIGFSFVTTRIGPPAQVLRVCNLQSLNVSWISTLPWKIPDLSHDILAEGLYGDGNLLLVEDFEKNMDVDSDGDDNAATSKERMKHLLDPLKSMEDNDDGPSIPLNVIHNNTLMSQRFFLQA